MAWKVSADPVDFEEAIAWFRKRVAMTKADYERLGAQAKRKAFTVSNVAQLDLVNQAWAAMEKALADGTSFDDFKKTIGEDLRKAWAGSVDDPAWRLETIFRTNLQNAYSAGRYQQARHPDVIADRPVWMFDAILDGRETPICRKCDGTKLPADHPWWKDHVPPLHFNCRSGFITLTEKQAGKITLSPPAEKPLEGFGLTPATDEWAPDLKQYPKPLAKTFAKKQKEAPPPPPPPRLTKDKHFKAQSLRATPKEVAEDLLDSIDEAETLKWLEEHPLDEIVFTKTMKPGVNGQYSVWKKPDGTLPNRLQIRTGDPLTFGKEWKPGESFTVNEAAPTKAAAMRQVLRHELGHHIHVYNFRGDGVDVIVGNAYQRARLKNVFITKYAKTHKDEYFAECYAAYYHRRSDLKAFDPNGYEMVEAVLKYRGILP